MFNKPIKISRLIFINQFFLIVVFLLIASSVLIYDEYRGFKVLARKQYSWQINENKELLKMEMRNFLDFMDVVRRDAINDSLAKEIILDMASRVRLEGSGYFFINQKDGKALVFNGKRVNNLNIAGFKDVKGNDLFAMELDLYYKPNGGFMTYYFRKINDSLPHKKISYVVPYKDFEWIIGVGNYVEDIHDEVEDFLVLFRKEMMKNIFNKILLFISLFVFIYFFSKWISVKIMTPVNKAWNHLKNRINGEEKNRDTFDYVKIKELKMFFDNMEELISKKLELEEKQKQYSQELEELVNRRTADLEKKAAQLQKMNEDLEMMNEVFVNREFRIKELREKVEKLSEQIKSKDR